MNAKQELLNIIQGKPKVKCIIIKKENENFDLEITQILKVNFTISEWLHFLEQINFDYDSGYGGQNLFGTIWFEDGTWCDRGEYDGSEWWEYHKCPEIETILI